MSKKKPNKTKKVKSKTSGVKQRNRLRNKGKIKTKKHVSKSVLLAQLRNKQNQQAEHEEEEEVGIDDIADMVEADDRVFSQVRRKKPQKSKKIDDIEDQYEQSKPYQLEYNTRMLLPVKTKEGLERRYAVIDEDLDNAEEENEVRTNGEVQNSHTDLDQNSWLNSATISNGVDLNEPISMAKIYARREEVIQKYKFRIGILSSAVLENPEEKVDNLSALLEIMDKNEPELQLTIKKLVILSMLEIFKDLVPAYQIKHQHMSGAKIKKVTKQLLGYESQLLNGYKEYLTRLEKLTDCLRKKKGDTRPVSKQEKGLGVLAVRCLCDLLIAHPYFNFADNIVHLLTLYLDNPDETIRKQVEDCYRRIFQEDKRGFISLVVVRRINYLVKTRAHSVHCEALSVLLSLRIKNVNLDQEKEDEIKNKRLKNKKQKLISSMSKNERKRKKELEKLEKEMLEAEAEESKKNKEEYMTEITKAVFLIYFRILKTAPRSNLLSITLEGVAKFAHCINLQYYQDLVNILDKLLENEPLNIQEQLYCIKTVFIILAGQEEVLSIDPLYFYSHLYRVMLSVHAGKTYESIPTLLSTLEAILVQGRKKVTTQRMLSFTKRLSTLALQLMHNGSLGALAIIKSVLQLTKTSDLLLDVECNYGQGIYNAELNEPEYCNAGNTALWELCALRRHYHPVTRKMSNCLSNGASTSGEGSIPADLAKMTCMSFYKEYNPSTVAFKPSIPPPRNKPTKKSKTIINISGSDFLNSCNNILNNVNEEVDFSLIK